MNEPAEQERLFENPLILFSFPPQHCLVGRFKHLKKTYFHKNSKWLKNQMWQIFCKKIHDFLEAKPQ
jgi:hypothetical protein